MHVPKKKFGLGSGLPRSLDKVTRFKDDHHLNHMLYKYYVSQNKESTITLMDADFLSIKPNYILTIVAHFHNRQSSNSSIISYSVAINFLKDYVAGFYRSDIEFARLFGIESVLAKLTFELPKA